MTAAAGRSSGCAFGGPHDTSRTMSVRTLLRPLDRLLFRSLGPGWLGGTRSPTISDRAHYLLDYVAREPGDGLRLLDVGCGAAMNLAWLDRHARGKIAEYVGIDHRIDGLAARYAHLGLPHRFQAIWLDDDWDLGAFDIVTCFEVIEHLSDDARLFARLARHVNPGGLLLVTSPSAAFVTAKAKLKPGYDTISPSQDGGHVRIGYTPARFRELAQANGMVLVSLDWTCRFDEAEFLDHENRISPLQHIWFNLRHARSAPGVRYVLDGDTAGCAETYLSIAGAFRHAAAI
jgi:SAM-dependent methyltransferase